MWYFACFLVGFLAGVWTLRVNIIAALRGKEGT